MLPTPLQRRYKYRINVRPVKHAYFVWQHDVESLRRVLRLVCTQWGGQWNLIIPVQPDLTIAPLFERLLKLHEPDLFVSYLKDLQATDYEENNQLAQYLRALWPHRKVSVGIGDYFEKADHTAHALSVIPDQEFSENMLTVHRFDVSSDLPVCLALFGAIYPGQEDDYRETVALQEVEVAVGGDGFWDGQFDNSPFSSVLDLTTYGVTPYTATAHIDSNHFDVVLVDSPDSLCMFWNLRATRDATRFRKDMGRRTLLLPVDLLDDYDTLRKMLSLIRSRLPYPNTFTNLHVRFSVWSEEGAERVRSSVSQLDEVKEFSDDKITIQHRWSQDEPRRLQQLEGKPLRYLLKLPDFPQSYFERVGHQAAQQTELSYGENELFFEPPSEFRNRFGGTTALDIVCDVWGQYAKDRQVSEAVKSGSWFSRYGLTFIATTSHRPHYIGFTLPGEWDTLKLFFRARGYDIRLSRPGTYARALVDLLGGIKGLDLLASEAAYRLLHTLALKSTKKLAQRIVNQLDLPEEGEPEIQSLLEDMHIVPELKRIPKTYRQLADGPLSTYKHELQVLLTELSRRQIVKRGLYLTCEDCGTPTWYPLGNLREIMVCPGCSSEFPLPVEYPKGSGGEIQWEYTLNTLVNRAVDQDVLPAVSAIRHLSDGRQVSSVVPGLELLTPNRVKAELDFVFISEQEMFAGECKAGAEIGDKDIDTARLAADLGFDHFYFCTIARFSDTSRHQIENLGSEFESSEVSMDLTILEETELLKDADE